jgi:hypothetical protein
MFAFWFVTPYGLADKYQRFGGTYSSIFRRSTHKTNIDNFTEVRTSKKKRLQLHPTRKIKDN